MEESLLSDAESTASNTPPPSPITDTPPPADVFDNEDCSTDNINKCAGTMLLWVLLMCFVLLLIVIFGPP